MSTDDGRWTMDDGIASKLRNVSYSLPITHPRLPLRCRLGLRGEARGSGHSDGGQAAVVQHFLYDAAGDAGVPAEEARKELRRGRDGRPQVAADEVAHGGAAVVFPGSVRQA